MNKNSIRDSISAAALLIALGAANAANAQNAGDADSAQSSPRLEDIVVTARKVAENLQSVPVAITAFSGQALIDRNTRNVADVANYTPGLVIRTSPLSGAAPLIQLRGQLQPDIIPTLDPSVGIYVDGLYWARATGINADLLDIKNVQVLKGPQGTLFGRNTTGGAILVQTNDPQFNGISGLVSGTYGRFNQLAGTAILNVPIVDDKLAIRLGFQRNKRDGYIDNPLTGKKQDNVNSWTGRAKLLYKPTETLSILLSGEWYKTDFRVNPFRTAYVSPTSQANLIPAVDSGFGTVASCAASAAARAACIAQGQALYAANIAEQASGDVVRIATSPRALAKTRTYTATITLDTFFGAIKAIGGYRHLDDNSRLVFGALYPTTNTDTIDHITQWSGEVQATGKAFNDAVDFAAGVFYFQESGTATSTSRNLSSLQTTITRFAGTIDHKSQGLYSQVTYHATDKLSITGGLRYSVDDKGLLSGNGSFNNGTDLGPAPGAIFTCFYPTCPTLRKNAFSGISYTAGLDYQVTRDIMAYAKTSRGFRSGGQNLRSASLVTLIPFKPEIATTYEGGVKSELLDRHLRVNLAGYYTIVRDIQRITQIFDVANARNVQRLGNAGRADFYGGEIEVNAVLPAGFALDGSAAYTKPKYKDYIDAGFDRSHEPFGLIPRWTFTVSPSFAHDFDFGRFSLRGDLIYTSKMSAAPQGVGYFIDSAGVPRNASTGAITTATQAAAVNQALEAKASAIVNARAALQFDDNKFEIAVFGKNLTNNRGKVQANFSSGVDVAMYIPREPRTYGVTATVRFGER